MVATAVGTSRRRTAVVLRFVGWALVAAGMIVLLYLVYSLVFTSRQTNAAQSALAEEWGPTMAAAPPDSGEAAPDLVPGARPEPTDGPPETGADAPETRADPPETRADPPETGAQAPGTEAPAPAPDEPAGEADDPRVGGEDPAGAARGSVRAVAVLEFARPGTDARPVSAEPLFVVDDVTLDALTRGPGHYPQSADPGEPGNFAVAGHRTTYGGPFLHLDQLRPGDEVHVTGRDGRRHTYRVRDQRVVSPTDTWVVGPDPLGSGRSMLTLTTCHPRFSARQRLVVWAELV